MNKNKETAFIIKGMLGGGAERVISLISRAVADRGYDVTLILTHQKAGEALLVDVDSRIKVVSLPDEAKKSKSALVLPRLLMLWARIIGKINMAEKASVLKYYSRNYDIIRQLKKYFKKHKNSAAVAFLYDSIFMTLLAACKSNKIIISERGDPQQSAAKRTVAAFMNREFPKADGVVFQSPDAQKWYAENTPVRGTVIFNPVKPDLPQPCFGEKQKRIVNFCRISKEKNLIMLVDAFARFRKDFPDYELYIYGNPVGDSTNVYLKSVEERIRARGCEKSVHLLPARSDIHSEIRDYAMFVSSSDFEGMSNSMLEAMALGLPAVCTDCPAGGARAVIKDGENGLLVPVGDSEKLYLAMKKLIENPTLSEEISKNAVQIRESLSVEKIIENWMVIIND